MWAASDIIPDKVRLANRRNRALLLERNSLSLYSCERKLTQIQGSSQYDVIVYPTGHPAKID